MKKLTKTGKINNRKHPEAGFNITEMTVVVAILSALSGVAIPTYLDQKAASCQGYPNSIIQQAMSQTQAYNDEYGDAAQSWGDLDKIGTIMTSSGPATGGDLSWIELPNCDYRLMGERDGNEYTFIAAQSGSFIPPEQQDNNNEIDELKNKYNVVGCVNVATGASDIQSGTGETAVSTSSLSCG